MQLEYRRTIAIASGATTVGRIKCEFERTCNELFCWYAGATHCAAPECAIELIHSLTDGRGADVRCVLFCVR
jgi:hypothetical protein